MRSTSRDIEDILDMVEAESGWRVEGTTKGWQIFPPDRAMPIIQVGSRSTDLHAADNLRAQLRRANFPPLLRTKKPARSTEDMPAPKLHLNGIEPSPPPPPQAIPTAEPAVRNLVREARSHIQAALEALSAIDTLLGEIEGERLQIQRLKEMFASVLK